MTECERVAHGAMLMSDVATRWYRAPEVMLSFRMYTKVGQKLNVALTFSLSMCGRSAASSQKWSAGDPYSRARISERHRQAVLTFAATTNSL